MQHDHSNQIDKASVQALDQANDPYAVPSSTIRDRGIVYVDAPLGRRLVNFVIDYIAHWICLIIVFLSIEGLGFYDLSVAYSDLTDEYPIIWAIQYGVYYFLFEWIAGRTPGKVLTDTYIISQHGERPGLLSFWMRSLTRLFPLDFISIFFSSERRCWHDIWSKTHVVIKT